MDISKITDVQQLKAAAYDQLVLKQQTEQNLVAINQRIVKLEQRQNVESKTEKPSTK